MLSVASSCHYNENSKNGKNRLSTNGLPSGATPTNPRPRAKAKMQKPKGGGKFLVQIRWGIVMAKIDSCIIGSEIHSKYMLFDLHLNLNDVDVRIIFRSIQTKMFHSKKKTGPWTLGPLDLQDFKTERSSPFTIIKPC